MSGVLGAPVRHLAATERFMFVENAWLRPSRYSGHGLELAHGYREVMTYFRKMHETSLDLLRQLSDDDLARKCITPGGTPITVWK